jgi:hypothetical protein
MNFLQSFSLSGFISVVTMCNLVHEEKEGRIEEFIIILKVFCIIYSVFGLLTAFFLYGRKAYKRDREEFGLKPKETKKTDSLDPMDLVNGQ